MKPKYEGEIQKKINNRYRFYYSIILSPLILFGIVILIIFILTALKVSSNCIFIVLFMVIPVIISGFYYLFKSSFTFVPIDIFLLTNEQIRFSSVAIREDLGGRGTGMCYLTNERLIYLPTFHARSSKDIFEFLIPIEEIKSISRISPYDHMIKTRKKRYKIDWHDQLEWKKFFKKIKHIDISNF